MPTFLSELLAQVRGIWSRLDAGQRLTISSVCFASLVGLGAIVWFAGQPDYVSVHSSEDPNSLDEAARALSSAGIGFKEDGSSILVDRTVAGRASSALLRSGVSGAYDPERDDGPPGVTMDSLTRQDALNVKRNRRAQKAVMQIDGVAAAYVTSTVPKRSVFSAQDNTARPRAAVTLTLRRGEAFSPIARAAVRQVAASVGVPEENVIAIDSRTKQTFSLDESGNDVGGVEFLEQQRRRSNELTQLAQQWLNRLYEGKALVTVTVNLDPTYSTAEEKIQPATPAIVSDDSTKDSTTREATVSSDPNAADAQPVASGPAQKSETRRRTYEPFSGIRRTGMLSPEIRRMTIALVLDESIDASKHESIQNAIKTTVGYMDQRPGGLADELQLHVEAFPELPELEVMAGPGAIDVVREFGPMAGQILAVVLVLLFLRRLLRTSSPSAQPREQSVAPPQEPPSVVSMPVEEMQSLAPEERRRRLRRDIEKSIADDPSTMSRVLEGWLSEQRT